MGITVHNGILYYSFQNEKKIALEVGFHIVSQTEEVVYCREEKWSMFYFWVLHRRSSRDMASIVVGASCRAKLNEWENMNKRNSL